MVAFCPVQKAPICVILISHGQAIELCTQPVEVRGCGNQIAGSAGLLDSASGLEPSAFDTPPLHRDERECFELSAIRRAVAAGYQLLFWEFSGAWVTCAMPKIVTGSGKTWHF